MVIKLMDKHTIKRIVSRCRHLMICISAIFKMEQEYIKFGNTIVMSWKPSTRKKITGWKHTQLPYTGASGINDQLH